MSKGLQEIRLIENYRKYTDRRHANLYSFSRGLNSRIIDMVQTSEKAIGLNDTFLMKSEGALKPLAHS